MNANVSVKQIIGIIDERPDVPRRRRKPVPGGHTTCSRCQINERQPYGRYCLACHAAVQREWRKTHPLAGEQLRKARSRAIAGVYARRGKLQKQPCETCGNADSQKHHPDYSKPLDVVWLCRPCHLALHKDDPIVRYRVRRQTAKQGQKAEMNRRLRKIESRKAAE